MTIDTRTHYIPSFTRRDTKVVRHDGQGRLQAICTAWTWPEQHRTNPADLGCWGCKTYIENLDVIEPETAEELRAS